MYNFDSKTMLIFFKILFIELVAIDIVVYVDSNSTFIVVTSGH